AWFHKPISSLRDGVDTFLVGARLLLWNAAQLEIAMVIVVLGGAAVVLLVRTDLPADASAALGRGRDSLRRAPVTAGGIMTQIPVESTETALNGASQMAGGRNPLGVAAHVLRACGLALMVPSLVVFGVGGLLYMLAAPVPFVVVLLAYGVMMCG
ncbi:hypothetical protein, partial [Mycobacteroides abscessus]|uniref:hypothetical protein n=1 Tax=Mycobacteroides abscessus TaxID=36809 RepID=UPI0013F5AE79